METIFKLQSVQKVIGVEDLTSTHDLARALAPTQPHATLVLACCQQHPYTPGGEPVVSGEGGVYFTLILKRETALDKTCLEHGLRNALADTLAHVFGLKLKQTESGSLSVRDTAARNYKKIAAVSTEQTAPDTYLLSAAVALNNRLSGPVRGGWITLKKLIGSETSKELFLEEVLDNFWKEYAFI